VQLDAVPLAAAPVGVRVSSRARRIRILVTYHGVEVVVPRAARQRDVERVLAEHAAWIARTRARLAGRPRLQLDLPGRVVVDGAPLAVESLHAPRPRVQRTDGGLRVEGPDPAARARALERWCRASAAARLAALTAYEGERLTARPRRVQVRAQRSRFGSYTPATGTLTLNWRLMVTPLDVQRYVVVHELCHIGRADHSRAFWELVAEAMPGFDAHRRWLRAHGDEVLAFEPAAALGA
jgi:predicted metal-dependent hydrolase